MARVTNYSTLATAVQAYLAQTDVGVSAGNLDYLCAEVEQELNARLRVRHQLTAITPTVSSAGVVTLPTGFLGWARFQVRDGTVEWDLDLKAAESTTEVSSLYQDTGVPRALITNGATSQIWPYTDGVYTFRGLHFLKVPELSSGAATNWVITNYPMAYVYGCLAAARGFVMDDETGRFAMWAKRFDRVVAQIQRESAKDTDARKNATLGMDTSLFGSRMRSNIEAGE